MHSQLFLHLLWVLSICHQSFALYYKGFNIGGNPFGDPCKTQAQWAQDFATMQAMPGAFSSARLFASSDCGTLAQAVPAAVDSGTTLLAGIWTEDNGHYEAEKAALLQAVKQYGTSWLIAVSVGSEDLYRGDTNATILSHQINEVRSLLAGVGASHIEVGHVDTWSAWIKPENADVIKACDFVGHDGYPYWEQAPIDQGVDAYHTNLAKTRAAVKAAKPGTPVWVVETGWPVTGDTIGPAVPSIENAQKYWKDVACLAFSEEDHTFWYALQDYGDKPSFGVVGPDFKPLYDLSCWGNGGS